MNLVGIENITPYKNVFEYSVYKYEDEIDLGNKELFVCDLKIMIINVEEVYAQRIGKSVEALVLVSNLSEKSDENTIKDEIQEFVFQEIYEENLEKENIDILFIKS